MEEFLNEILFTLNETPIYIGEVITVIGIGLIITLLYFLVVKKSLSLSRIKGAIEEVEEKKLDRILVICLLLIFLIIVLSILHLDQATYTNKYFSVTLPIFIKGILIIQIARLANYFINGIIKRYYRSELIEELERQHPWEKSNLQESNAGGNLSKSALYIFAFYLLLHNFSFDAELLIFNNGTEDEFKLRISNIILVFLILLVGRVFVWGLTQLILLNYYQKKEVNLGAQFAINQLISYFIYVLATVTALHYIGIQMTVVWGGFAALLVGVGLGLQQTFNDLFSGILLLFERDIEVGEIIEIEGVVGNVKKIGLRTSIIESRDNITMIVPNSKLVMENIINWSHYDDKVRFRITVGVAYGSDTALVKEILLETAKEHSFILKYPTPNIRFVDFGSSSLDFELLFFSKNFTVIEDIKSDLRFEIDRKFREANIAIPFPQRDVWFRQ